MKLTQAIKEVWQRYTKDSPQWLIIFDCGGIVLGPFAFVTWFGFFYLPSTPWAIQIPLWIATIAWARFWMKVFSKWWPF